MNVKTIGCCGLFCESCDIYQSLHNGKLKRLAETWGMDPEDLACDGCRSDRRSEHARDCALRACCLERGHDNCGECRDFPCAMLHRFAAGDAPHREQVIDNCAFFRKAGRFEWYHLQRQRWTCSCGQIFTWYQARCSRCGAEVEGVVRREAGRRDPPPGEERESSQGE